MIVARDFFASIVLTFRQHKIPAAKASATFYGFTWLVVNSSTYYDASLRTSLASTQVQIAMVALSLLIGIFVSRPTRRISFTLKNTDTKVTVVFSDLFSESGAKALAVTEYFDSAIGDLVSPKSLHGMLIEKKLGGHGHTFDALVSESLKDAPRTIVSRPKGNTSQFPIGTTAVIPVNNEQWYLVALCKTDLTTHKASATAGMLMEALSGLWSKIRITAGGQRVSIPLIGGGISGIGMPPACLLETIIISLLDETKKQKITSEVQIVLHDSIFDLIDLNQVKKNWS